MRTATLGFGVLMAIALVSGCVSGPAFVAVESPKPGQAVVYVYRSLALGGAALNYPVTIQGRRVGAIRVASYLRAEVPAESTPSRVQIQGQGCVSPTSPVLVAVGKTVYVEVVVEMSQLSSAGTYLVPDYRCRLMQRTDAEALSALPGLRRAE
jgi:hypothetical protein